VIFKFIQKFKGGDFAFADNGGYIGKLSDDLAVHQGGMYSADENSDTGEIIVNVFNHPETGGTVIGENIKSGNFRFESFNFIYNIKKTPVVWVVVQEQGFNFMPALFQIRVEVSQSQGIMRIPVNYRRSPAVFKRGGYK
jgi:hypothetical protein